MDTSSKNTTDEWQVRPSSYDSPAPITKVDQSAAKLEGELQEEKDSRREERFVWILACTYLSDVIIFKFLDNWGYSLPMFLLQLIFLIALADWLGVDRAKILLEALFSKFAKPPDGGPTKD